MIRECVKLVYSFMSVPDEDDDEIDCLHFGAVTRDTKSVSVEIFELDIRGRS